MIVPMPREAPGPEAYAAIPASQADPLSSRPPPARQQMTLAYKVFAFGHTCFAQMLTTEGTENTEDAEKMLHTEPSDSILQCQIQR